MTDLFTDTLADLNIAQAALGMPTSYYGQTFTRCFPPQADAGNAITYGMSQSAHYARDKVKDLLIGEFPAYRMTGASETDRGQAGTLKVAARMPDNSWLLTDQVRDNSDNPVVHAPGNLKQTWTLNNPLPDDFKLLLREYQYNAAGIYWTGVGGGNTYANHPDDFMDLGTSPNDKTTNGASIGAANGIGYFPVVLASKTVKPSLMINGTSRDTGGAGWIGDYLTDLGITARTIGKRFGYSNWALAGTLLANWNAGSHAYFNALLNKGYFSHLSNEYGINDVPQDAAAATTAARRALFASNVKAVAPGIVIIGHTLFHYVGSTDLFVSKANQSQGTNNPRVIALNGLILAGIAGEDKVWDVYAALDPLGTGLLPVTQDYFTDSYTPTVFVGSIASGSGGTTLTVTSITSGPGLKPNDAIMDPTDTGGGVVIYNTSIRRQLTGTPGGAGTYLINLPYDNVYPHPNGLSSRTLSTAGRISRDGLHLQNWGEDMVVKNKGNDLIGFMRR